MSVVDADVVIVTIYCLLPMVALCVRVWVCVRGGGRRPLHCVHRRYRGIGIGFVSIGGQLAVDEDAVNKQTSTIETVVNFVTVITIVCRSRWSYLPLSEEFMSSPANSWIVFCF